MKFITCWSCGAAIWLHAPTCTHFSFFNYLGIFYSVRVTFWILSSPISQVANYALAHFRLALISRIQMSALLAKGQKKKKKKKEKAPRLISMYPSCPKLFPVRLLSMERNVLAEETLRWLSKIRSLLFRETETKRPASASSLPAVCSLSLQPTHTCRLGFIYFFLPSQQMKQTK